MSAWKVILATLVIFIAGLVTGGVGVMKLATRSEPNARRYPPILPRPLRSEFVDRLQRELDLTAEQRRAIADILRESQERVGGLYEDIGPQLAEEMAATRGKIRALLSPDQARRYEQMHRRLPPRPGPGESPLRERRLGDRPPSSMERERPRRVPAPPERGSGPGP